MAWKQNAIKLVLNNTDGGDTVAETIDFYSDGGNEQSGSIDFYTVNTIEVDESVNFYLQNIGQESYSIKMLLNLGYFNYGGDPESEPLNVYPDYVNYDPGSNLSYAGIPLYLKRPESSSFNMIMFGSDTADESVDFYMGADTVFADVGGDDIERLLEDGATYRYLEDGTIRILEFGTGSGLPDGFYHERIFFYMQAIQVNNSVNLYTHGFGL